MATIPFNREVETMKMLKILSNIYDPEIPVVSIVDLGILRDVSFSPEGICEITITPTYSGCPAMDVINMSIRLALIENGYSKFSITTVLSPAWTTEWISEEGKNKLKAFGIAPPVSGINQQLFGGAASPECPRCRSANTVLLSEFGSTSCKALYQCRDCKEPFDYFKCH